MADQIVTLKLSFPGEQPTRAVAQVHEWNPFERVTRTVLGLALTWLAAGIAIFMPVLHWVLVPSLLLAGPVVAILRGTEARRLMSMKGVCPRCKVEREYKLGIRFNGPRSFTCNGCGNLIELEQVETPAVAAAPAPGQA